MSLTPGTRLGPYEIVAPLGAGGMGEVYRARDSRLGRDVAIKALPAEFARNPEQLGRFEREAQTLASLSHPNIAAIHGLEERDGVPHLVLELVEGESLAARLARGALPSREALSIGVQIASAVEAAHERGVIHRDLKPANVMITTAGVAKVLDFGLAKNEPVAMSGSDLTQSPTAAILPGATVAGTILGTAAYMSPEQARGLSVDRRSDVWSFGCVLFECFTGKTPFEGATVTDLLAKILEREPDWTLLPAGTPPRVREILRRCLRKEADERPRDIRDVRLELAEVASGAARISGALAPSVAVIPFENLSGADDEYFSDGITDEILNALVHLDGLRVAARTSCFAFKGRREDLRVVGEKLDVATVLEGSVRRSGNRLRITVQLVNAADGYQLWSERYDREMTDVFEVQDEIAGEIARRLRVTLQDSAEGFRGRRGTANLEAYELVLKGRAMQLRRGRYLSQAIECFERAIALDPNYPEPLAWMSDSWRLMGTFGVAPFAEVMPRAKDLALRALALDSNLPEAIATLADVEAQYDRDWPKAAASFARALAVDPRHVRSRCERALWGHGWGAISAEEAVAETERAVADDPLNAWALGMLSFAFSFAGRHEDSVRVATQAIAADSESFFGHWQLLRAHAWAGDYQRAVTMGPALLAGTGRHHWALAMLGWTHSKAGNLGLARAAYDELEGRSRLEFIGPGWLSAAADAAGLRDEALHYAGRAFTERDPLVILMRQMPPFAELREDPRFVEMSRGVWE
ncbi:MAG: protein kinase [Candidatus Eisenbacteria bacterium]|nr:protein kinase [Candidatus Eisenbacteria bacterium]